MKLPGLTPISLLMFTGVLAVWLGVSGPIDATNPWPLLGAIIAIAGVWVALRNVNRQIRTQTLLREEDRIDRLLPGLIAAKRLMDEFTGTYGGATYFQGIVDQMQMMIGTQPYEAKTHEKLLPNTDDATRRSVMEVILTAYSHAAAAGAFRFRAARDLGPRGDWAPGHYETARADLNKLAEQAQVCEGRFHDAINGILSASRSMQARIERYERRGSVIRAEIEQFFDRDK